MFDEVADAHETWPSIRSLGMWRTNELMAMVTLFMPSQVVYYAANIVQTLEFAGRVWSEVSSCSGRRACPRARIWPIGESHQRFGAVGGQQSTYLTQLVASIPNPRVVNVEVIPRCQGSCRLS